MRAVHSAGSRGYHGSTKGEMGNQFRGLIDTLRSRSVEACRELCGGVAEGYRWGFVRPLADIVESFQHLDQRGYVRFEPSAAELAMRRVSDPLVRLGKGIGWTYRARSPGGGFSVYKPGYLEDMSDGNAPIPLRYGIPFGAGHLAYREQAAYRVDEALGFGRVPPTTVADGPYGLGSNQIWVHSGPAHPVTLVEDLSPEQRATLEIKAGLRHLITGYPRVQCEQMAVLDYVIGNTDRHLGNYRTGRHGEIVAIDHQLSFPESPDPRIGIRSGFVKQFLDVELSEEVMAQVRAVDLDRLRAALLDSKISEKAVDGALARLVEIRTHGKITGAAWPGEFTGLRVPWHFTEPLPVGWIEKVRHMPEYENGVVEVSD